MTSSEPLLSKFLASGSIHEALRKGVIFAGADLKEGLKPHIDHDVSPEWDIRCGAA